MECTTITTINVRTVSSLQKEPPHLLAITPSSAEPQATTHLLSVSCRLPNFGHFI